MDAMKENGIFRAVCFGRWRGAERRAVTPGVVLLLTQALYPFPNPPRGLPTRSWHWPPIPEGPKPGRWRARCVW